jgi:hypothetical protein
MILDQPPLHLITALEFRDGNDRDGNDCSPPLWMEEVKAGAVIRSDGSELVVTF